MIDQGPSGAQVVQTRPRSCPSVLNVIKAADHMITLNLGAQSVDWRIKLLEIRIEDGS